MLHRQLHSKLTVLHQAQTLHHRLASYIRLLTGKPQDIPPSLPYRVVILTKIIELNGALSL